MSEDTQEVAVEEEGQQVMVDDVSYAVDSLPQGIQNAITTYNVWVNDRAEAQKTAAQLASAVQHLANQISTAIREHVAASEAEEAGVATAGDEAPAEAALDIPSEEE